MATLLWEDNTTAQSRAYLRRAIWQLQSVLKKIYAGNKKILVTKRDWIQCNPALDMWLDVEIFESAYERIEGVSGADLSNEQSKGVEQALSLYEGELLEHCFQDWCLYERERLRHIYMVLLDKVIVHHEFQKHFERAIHYAEKSLVYDHTREQTHFQLMRLLLKNGNRSGALRQFTLCQEALNKDFNAEPSPETIALFKQIRDGQGGARPIDKNDMALRDKREPDQQTILNQSIQSLSQISLLIQQHIEFLKRNSEL